MQCARAGSFSARALRIDFLCRSSRKQEGHLELQLPVRSEIGGDGVVVGSEVSLHGLVADLRQLADAAADRSVQRSSASACQLAVMIGAVPIDQPFGRL